MSHQTGIKANDDLKKFFAKCRDGKVRVIKVSIEEEQLVLSDHKDVKNNWEKDFDKYITPLIEENQPCYILYRQQKILLGLNGYLLVGVQILHRFAKKCCTHLRKLPLNKSLGHLRSKTEIHGTMISDVTLNGYIKHKKSAAAPAPLSMREEELQEIKRTEVNTDISIDTKQQTLSGVAFPITQAAKQTILDMARGSYDYVQFRIDIEEETIHLVCAENIPLEKLPSRVPSDRGRYHLYKFKHTHEGDYMENIGKNS
ncbi:hypothetical protein NQ314_004568 [Rhamnusium bicolor]|uniref:ADF-H domain-containing protein n=1 Tax=Rhamnusium bicolor TaxID=1586634 RepID=A0AAV8ZJ31_9CUCU|nr:hypothetical protein NQ314_004568 [Rhamnusium bicolor]